MILAAFKERFPAFREPVELRFWWPHRFLRKDPGRHLTFVSFVQLMTNRLLLGGLQYGPASKTQRYAERAIKEFQAYLHGTKEDPRPGNREHLINAANYAFLEFVAPMISGAFFRNDVPSATRKKFGRGGYVPEALKHGGITHEQ